MGPTVEILRALAESFGPSYVEVVASSPHGAQVLVAIVMDKTLNLEDIMPLHAALCEWIFRWTDKHAEYPANYQAQIELIHAVFIRSKILKLDLEKKLIER